MSERVAGAPFRRRSKLGWHINFRVGTARCAVRTPQRGVPAIENDTLPKIALTRRGVGNPLVRVTNNIVATGIHFMQNANQPAQAGPMDGLIQENQFVGWVYQMDYEQALILTRDDWKLRARGVPLNCFLRGGGGPKKRMRRAKSCCCA